MKKVFGFVLMTFFAFSFLPAQEAEDEDEGGFGNPSISVENELSIKGTKSDKKEEKGKFTSAELENETTAKFGVGFTLFEGFTLKPYIEDKVVIGAEKGTFAFGFKKNDFSIGLGMDYQPMDMLTVSFGLGYISRWNSDGFTDEAFGSAKTETTLGNGVKLNAGVGLDVSSIFLSAGLEYKFSGMFAKDIKDDDQLKAEMLKNVIALEATFDFFNFIKEDLNSGLLFSNETTIEIKNAKDKKDLLAGVKTIENEFGIGLHFGMVKYMDFSFMTKVKSASAQAWNPADKKYGDPAKGMTIGLSLGLAFEKDMFSFGIEYNPSLKTEVDKKVQEENEHELKVTFGIAL